MNANPQKRPLAMVTSEPQQLELEHQIRLRAYELYEARGRKDGHELDDWLRAKEETREKKFRTATAWSHTTERREIPNAVFLLTAFAAPNYPPSLGLSEVLVMKPMTPSEWHAFLLFGKRTAKVATVRPDGRPHVAPVWFVVDSDILVFMTGKDTVKGRNIRRDPRVMLCIDDERPPFAFVLIEGTAVAADLSPAKLLPWSTRIARRYMGAEQAEAYGKRNAVVGELLVRVALTKVVAREGIAD